MTDDTHVAPDDQATRTAQVLALLDESFRAHAQGDGPTARRAIDKACNIDPMVVQAVRGGIMIGEIPDPGNQPTEWAEYVAAAQERASR